jgi:hypothetical protein
MGKFMSWNYVLRLLIIAVLFTIFVNIFAWPSINNYLDSGIFIDKHSVRRESNDTPAITFCAMVNETKIGWKNKTNFVITWVDSYCNNSKTVKDAVTCLDNLTYNLTETIRDHKNYDIQSINLIGTNNDLWTYDVTEAYKRGLFKGEILSSTNYAVIKKIHYSHIENLKCYCLLTIILGL